MTKNKKVVRYINTGAANIQKLQLRFITIAKQLEAEFIRLAVWMAVVGGALC